MMQDLDHSSMFVFINSVYVSMKRTANNPIARRKRAIGQNQFHTENTQIKYSKSPQSRQFPQFIKLKVIPDFDDLIIAVRHIYFALGVTVLTECFKFMLYHKILMFFSYWRNEIIRIIIIIIKVMWLYLRRKAIQTAWVRFQGPILRTLIYSFCKLPSIGRHI